MSAKIQVKQAFATASSSYDQVALLQKKVADSLVQRLQLAQQVDTIVDLGCGTGYVVDGLSQQKGCKAGQLIALDIALPMLQQARNNLNSNAISWLCADVENLPLQLQSVDWVVSSLAFQWCGNLAKALGDIKQSLKPQGQLAFTTFGTGTLQELKTAWVAVDGYAHVNEFYDSTQLTYLLEQAGFSEIELSTKTYLSLYESVWELMAELKQLGAHTVMAGRNKQLTSRAAMQSMIAAYQRQDENGLVPATFEVITAFARMSS